jgi:hypothetical protein
MGSGRSPAAAASSPSVAGSKSGTFFAISARPLSNAPPIASPSKRPPSRSGPPAAAAPAAAAARARRRRREKYDDDDKAVAAEASGFAPGLGKCGGGVEGDRSRIAMSSIGVWLQQTERGAPLREREREGDEGVGLTGLPSRMRCR